jgi:hypothetical protein
VAMSFATAPDILSKLPNAVPPFHGLTGCYQTPTSRPADFYVWIPPVAFETILCLFMLYKAWKLYRDDSSNPLMTLLIRDRYVQAFASTFEDAPISD